MASRTSAWPLSLLFAALVVYASLYPFDGWRVQGVAPQAFLFAPLPQYWTGFDVGANFLGYAPLGFLLALALRRSGAGSWSWLAAAGASALLSLSVEALQTFLPQRVPSNLDFALNSAGAGVGAGAAWVLERLGGLRRWSRLRANWFEPEARGGLVMLALWPFALLYPASVPFGLGQFWERLVGGLAEHLTGTPFLDWLPEPPPAAVGLSPLAEALCVALGLLAPVFMGYLGMRSVWQRSALFGAVLLGGWLTVGLSSALTYGPSHAWSWIGPQVELGLVLAVLLGLGALVLPRRWCALGLLLCLGVSIVLLNRAPASAYFAQSLEVWEQGRFIRFHGLSQWLGWLWPYAALMVGLRALVAAAQRRGRAR